MTDLTIKKDPAVLAIEIRNLQQQAQVVVLSYAIEIGRRLCEAKSVLDHGQWGPWLEEQVEFSQSTANNYMKIFERYGSEQLSLFGDAKSQTLGNLPYTKALKLLAVPEEETEEFLETHDVEAMSTRELEKAIRERDEAIADLTRERETGVTLAIKVDDLKAAAESARAEADSWASPMELSMTVSIRLMPTVISCCREMGMAIFAILTYRSRVPRYSRNFIFLHLRF